MDSLFFVASKVIWNFARPDHLLLLMFTLAWWQMRRARGVDGLRLSRRLFSVSLFSLWLIALYPVGNWLLYPLETRFAISAIKPERLAGIVVLGGGESVGRSEYWHRLELAEAGDRYLELVTLAQQYPELPIIFTGGSGRLRQNGFGGADALAPLLTRLGLEQRVLLERESRNTWENARLSRSLAEPLEARRGQQQWLLVTSAFHMPRSVGLFEQTGWQIQPWPVDFRSREPWSQGLYFDFADNLDDLVMGVREWIGLLAYRLSGKTRQLLPGVAGAYRSNPTNAY